MAAPTEYRSTDSSAPVLSGQVNTLIPLLDAILVNGYGAKAAAGWTKPYSGSSLAAYQNASLGALLRVDDSLAQMARVVGYQTLTSITPPSSGEYPPSFPTEAQFSGGLYVRKSTTADSTARPWVCFATDTTFYLFIKGNETTFAASGGDSNLAFGELAVDQCGLRGDPYRSFLIAASVSSTSETAQNVARTNLANINGNSFTGHYLAQASTQVGNQGVAFGKFGGHVYQLQAVSGNATNCATYPEPVTGGLIIGQITAREASTVRGVLPGLWSIAHAYTNFTTFDTFDGTGDISAKDFVIVHCGLGALAIETNGGW